MKKILITYLLFSSLIFASAQVPAISKDMLPKMSNIEGKNIQVSRTEVTQKLYLAVTGQNPSKMKGDRLPVTNISWYEAILFCNMLSEAEGLTPCYSVAGSNDIRKWGEIPSATNYSDWSSLKCDFNAGGYRLLTKEEWLYAAKGGENYRFAGNNTVGGVAWYISNSERTVHEVGEKYANAYDLFDMNGNVWEWCWNHFDGYATDMGGSFSDDPKYCILDGRGGNIPMETKTANLGFRICR